MGLMGLDSNIMEYNPMIIIPLSHYPNQLYNPTIPNIISIMIFIDINIPT